MRGVDASSFARSPVDLLLVGGGLANGLIAWRLRMLRPELRVAVVEKGPTLGGNHTWSFHRSDLTPAEFDWVAPLVRHEWPCHDVAFPGFTRRLPGAYCSVTSQHFNAVLGRALADAVHLNQAVASVAPDHVVLADGSRWAAGAVIDARGPQASSAWCLGYQKFLGQELQLRAPHGMAAPVLMDARVPQQGGYRFVYLLPFSPDTILVEDTVYADGDALDPNVLRSHINAYLAERGWAVKQVLREEHGVLPIMLAGSPDHHWYAAGGVAKAGVAAGLFHPTTGYSLPDAVRVADLIARTPDLSAASLFSALRAHALASWRRQGFYRLLNRMLFQAAAPAQRRAVMARFYGLPGPLIERFYGARSTGWDKLRILTGKPPVPLGAAARAAVSTRPRSLEVF